MRFEYEKLNENYSIFMKLGGGDEYANRMGKAV